MPGHRNQGRQASGATTLLEFWRPEQLPWRAFPGAAEDIADWVIAQSTAHRDHVVLIAARIPQELAVGLGIHLGQRRHEWPQHAYPVYHAHQELVVLDLKLGADSVPAERS